MTKENWSRASNKRYYLKNRSSINAKSKKWGKMNPERTSQIKRKSNIKWLYGITEDEINTLLEKQNFKCPICDKAIQYGNKDGHVDHDHNTGRVRSILCNKCNLGIGHFGDDIMLLTSALEYLAAHSAQRSYA